MKRHDVREVYKELLAGANAGVVGTVLGFPLDSIKTRMQSQQTAIQLGDKPVTVANTARLIYTEGGMLAFYRGLASPLLSLVILNTMNFSVYASLREQFGLAKDELVTDLAGSMKVAMAGASAGPLAAMISTPFELVKTQMQMNNKAARQQTAADSSTGTASVQPVRRNSITQTYDLVTRHGVRILYAGHAVNTAREMVFLSTYFTVYENSKSFFERALSPLIAIPFAGGFSGAAGWIVSFPLDCVKANIQGAPFVHRTDRPPATMKVAAELLRTKGFLGLYSGVVPSVLRAFLVSSSRFSAYEATLWLLE